MVFRSPGTYNALCVTTASTYKALTRFGCSLTQTTRIPQIRFLLNVAHTYFIVILPDPKLTTPIVDC